MSWFWGSGSNADKKQDPYDKLDAGLRQYLDKESPAQQSDKEGQVVPRSNEPQSASAASISRTPSSTYRAQLGLDVAGSDPPGQSSGPTSSQQSDKPVVPAQSLFPDGRYAHLWKTYRPQEELAAASRSDQDRLSEIAEVYKERKAAIGRAALENCVMEQLAERECWRNGGLKQTMTMCRAEGRAFTRCYTMQARFLKALGYLSSTPCGAEDDERIQMHADKLYHEMLEREKADEDARAAGREPPTFEPLIKHESVEPAVGGTNSAWSRARRLAAQHNIPSAFSQLPHETQKELGERMKGMSELERQVELQLVAAEQRAQLEYAEEIAGQLAEEKRQRAQRREQGKETFGDAAKRLWGWDK